jgi:hypothetical protein
MKRILFLILGAVIVLLGAVLVLGILADVSGLRTEEDLALVHDIYIWADNSSPGQYFADVASIGRAGNNTASYRVTRAGNTIQIKLFYLHWTVIGFQGNSLFVRPHEIRDTVPLGADFVAGVNYTVKANNVTVTFVA